jgi:hypothetical protein
MTAEELQLLGPLKHLAGIWEGTKGDDTAPGDDRGTEKNQFKERIEFKYFGAADNHEQKLQVLSYDRKAWRLGVDTTFHEQLGYWLWDKASGLVMHSFMIPRGMAVLAGGKASENDKAFRVEAQLGSPTFGICSNPFLDREFKTVKYFSDINMLSPTEFSYQETTQILMKGKEQIFNHIDKNTLKKLS